MKDYKRLTGKPVNGDKGYMFNCDNCPRKGASFCGTYDCLDMVCDRLGELEDKIEQGLILELPCKVGDTVYWVDDTVQGIIECEIVNYAITKIGYVLACKNDSDYGLQKRDFNKRWFLTKAEAEARLQEMRGEQ